ncbi:condensation domain-containing protein [Kitasatospora viridis]|uniref:Condensation domain-containing protein n=1 Tax=Kitasatospora viridis TaxID=281105 RepID=A0A561UMZ2_9ACTN|nr:condensation domain-containing protein [Kitasatospora viridis]TWG00729.1 condensation domain-containing protein [Kitasatospora viridis]
MTAATRRAAVLHRGPAALSQQLELERCHGRPDEAPRMFNATYTVAGPLDLERLRDALARVVARHSALRTSFEVGSDGVWALVHETAPVPLRVVELAADAGADPGTELDRLIDAESRRPLDRSAAPLFRLLVVRTGAGSHVLVFTFDHVIADGYALDLFLRDLSAAYATGPGVVDGPAGARTENAFLEWAEQQRQEIAAGEWAEAVDHWRAVLGTGPAASSIALPGHRGGERREQTADPAVESRCRQFPIGTELARGINRFAHAERLTEYSVGLAALNVLVATLTGLDRVTVNSTFLNRMDDTQLATVGWYACGMFPSTDVDRAQTFAEFADTTQEAVAEAIMHAGLPAGYLRRQIWTEGSAQARPLPIVYFMSGEDWGAGLELAGTTVAIREQEEEVDTYGIQFWITRDATGGHLHVLHLDSEYPPEAADALGRAYLDALRLLLDEPSRPLAESMRLIEGGFTAS